MLLEVEKKKRNDLSCNMEKYSTQYDKRCRKYGIVLDTDNGKRTKWWIKPQYDAIGNIETRFGRSLAWIKVGKNYGSIDVDARKVIVEPQYGYPLFWWADGPEMTDENIKAVVWKDHKTGVINLKGEIVMPIIYDQLYCVDGKIQTERPEEKLDWYVPENEHRTVEEITQKVIVEWKKLRAMGYSSKVSLYRLDDETRERIKQQKEMVRTYLCDRRQAADMNWEHNAENAARLSRTNDLLMKAVRKAMKVGKKTAQSLMWMNSKPKATYNNIEVFVYPQLSESDDDDILNIILQMGLSEIDQVDGISACFCHRNRADDERELDADWDLKKAILDDGQTWDEGIHHPAYQDVYFTNPWHKLFYQNFISLEDLAKIKAFCVDLRVHTETIV